MKIIVGTKFKSKKTGEEYTVVRRETSPLGVKVDFMDKNKKLFKNSDEQTILDKLKSGDLLDHKLEDPWKYKIEHEFNGDTRAISIKIFD